MVDESRFQRIENKVDEVKEDVNDISISLLEQKHTLNVHMTKIEEHIAGDNKVIQNLVPVLEKLPTIVAMAEEYTLNKALKKKTYVFIGKVVAAVTTFVGITASIIKILN